MLIAMLAAATLAAADGPVASKAVEVSSAKGGTTTIQRDSNSLAEKVAGAVKLIASGKSADAIPILDEVIAAEEASHKDEQRMMFSARTGAEVMIYTGMAGVEKKSAVVFDAT